MQEKIITAATALAAGGTIEVINQMPTDPSFYTEIVKVVLQIIVAVVGLVKMLKSKKPQ